MGFRQSLVPKEETNMAKIKCPKCGNDHEFAVIASSVFSIYVDGSGKTVAKEPLSEACTGIDRVECTICRAELDEVGYDIKKEEAFLYKEKYSHVKASMAG